MIFYLWSIPKIVAIKTKKVRTQKYRTFVIRIGRFFLTQMVHGGLASSSRDCNLIRKHLEQIILEVVSAFSYHKSRFAVRNGKKFHDQWFGKLGKSKASEWYEIDSSWLGGQSCSFKINLVLFIAFRGPLTYSPN